MVAKIVESQAEEIRRLCERFRVQRLEVFGSGVGSEFDRTRSDLDFLVEFPTMTPKEHTDAYFGLYSALTSLFRREVDLVEWEGVQNPYVRAAIERTKVPVYVRA